MSIVLVPKRRIELGGTAAALALANTLLYLREWCIETDTGRFKIGPGRWNDLPYASSYGLHAVPIKAGSMVPAKVSGCASLTNIVTSSAHPDILTLDFDGTVREHAQFSITLPPSYDGGDFFLAFVFSHASGSGDVIWGAQAVAIGDGDAIDVAYGTAQEVTKTSTGAGEINTTVLSAALTAAGTPQPGDELFVDVYRKADSSSDTLSGIDARLHGVVLYLTTDKATDE